MSDLDAARAEGDYRTNHLRKVLRRIATAADAAAQDMVVGTDNLRGRTAAVRRLLETLNESLALAEASQRAAADYLSQRSRGA